MRSLLSSPRRRRRLLVGGIAALLVAGVTFSMIHWSNTSPYKETFSGGPVQRPVVPVKAPFKQAKQEGVLEVAAAFVNTAVKRSHVERSFDLASPALRTGYTRKTWATQDIPVQPYPVDLAKWQVKSSFVNEVWLQVAVFPDKAHAEVPAAVFDIVLRPFGRGESRRWLVDSWAPAGYQGVPSGPLTKLRNGGSPLSPVAAQPEIEYRNGISPLWLFVPVSAFALGFVVLGFIWARGWWRGRRALAHYKSTYR